MDQSFVCIPMEDRANEKKNLAMLGHELTHVEQALRNGLLIFDLRYAWQNKFGYNKKSKFEKEAYEKEKDMLKDLRNGNPCRS